MFEAESVKGDWWLYEYRRRMEIQREALVLSLKYIKLKLSGNEIKHSIAERTFTRYRILRLSHSS